MATFGKVLFGIFLAISCYGQMPHECVLLVNRKSQDSMRVANTYLSYRQIPRRNVIYLDIPSNLYDGTATVTPDQFTWLIWEPANKIIKERGLDDQVLAWIYSVDFPIRVKTDSNDRKQMSVCGLTFMRNKIPGLSLVEDGKYLSKVFAGPNERIRLNLNSMSFSMQKKGLGKDAKVPPEAAWLQRGLGDRMPLPNMMLGYTGDKGNSVQEVLNSLARGAASDYRGVRSGIYFIQSDDVRSTCREWQHYPAVNELKKRGITATVTTNFPAGEKGVMGIMMGAETANPSAVGSFANGAMAEHLTSWSAEFQKRQSKCTDWIAAGATASAGAVVEPYSNPNKFPSARFFVHYASGCSMMESFFQSIACPLQLLLVGDPLAKPFAPTFGLKIMGADTMKNDFTYMVMADAKIQGAAFEYTYLVDGEVVQKQSDKNSIYMRINKLSDGYHELRVVANLKHMVEFNMTLDKGIMVDRSGRSVSIAPEISKVGKREHGIKAMVGGREMPEKIRLVSGEKVLDEKVYAEDAVLVLDEMMMGEGPNRVRAVAIYADGMEVSSKPISFGIAFSKD